MLQLKELDSGRRQLETAIKLYFEQGADALIRTLDSG